MGTHNVTLRVANDGSGPLVDFVTLPSGNVRQSFILSDPDLDNADTKVLGADPGLTDFGAVVRPIRDGNTVFYLLAAATTNATNIKASAGRVFHVRIFNTTSALLYTKFYELSTAPTVGSSTIKFTLPCQAGIWTPMIDSDNGMKFTTGIAIATTLNLAAADATAVAANSLVIIIEWK